MLLSTSLSIQLLLNRKKPVFDKKLITFRKLCSIDFDNFGPDVTNSSLPSLSTTPLSCLDDLIIQYDDVLSSILEVHAPILILCVLLHLGIPRK